MLKRSWLKPTPGWPSQARIRKRSFAISSEHWLRRLWRSRPNRAAADPRNPRRSIDYEIQAPKGFRGRGNDNDQGGSRVNHDARHGNDRQVRWRAMFRRTALVADR